MKKAFTLVETVIVVVIMGILLSSIVGFGGTYLKTLKTKQDKEKIISTVDYILSFTRSTNYYEGQKFTYVDVGLTNTGIYSTLSFGSNLETKVLEHMTLTYTGSAPTIRIIPYQRGCELISASGSTLEFGLQSDINDDEYCFTRYFDVCKLFLVSCG